MPDVCWRNEMPMFSSQSALSKASGDLIISHGLFQFVENPTRITPSTSNTLDLFFANSPDLIRDVLTIPGISDHECVTACIVCACPHTPVVRPRKLYLYDRGNFGSISLALEEYFETFESLTASSNIDDLWSLLKHKLLTLIDLHIPFKILSAKQSKNKPWFTKKVKTLINKRKRIFKKYHTQKEVGIHAALDPVNI
ncbi:hypothetical protein HPB48_020314 [Haemaphysalis longicornis]|uniref:Uncharacterized protein n=1 Tax=Haemaphysalis longicornis TaxID=44386 RepID=A0A9J6GT15_HAELO|nr:hypothetical protein HPB48_020314 [Haemaphysalis longicornis]